MKKLLCALVLMLAAASANAQELSFDDKRAIDTFKTQTYPGLEKQIQEAAGSAVTVQVDWDKIGAYNFADTFDADATRLYFTPLINALKHITKDDFGKKALNGKLKKIVVTDSKQYIDPSHYSFKDGVLTIDHKFLNMHNPESREKKIVSVLNSGL